MKTGKTEGQQQGFFLVEAMVALIVLSVGIVGLAASQLTASKNNVSAMLRSEAAIYSGEIIDRMRANIVGAACGQYDIDEVSSLTSVPSNQAEEDLEAWLNHLNGAFGGVGVRASIDCSQEPDCATVQIPVCEITIEWDDSRASGQQSEDIVAHTTHVHL